MNNHLLAFERSVSSDSKEHREPAKSMLTFMVKGLFTSFKFPYVHFSGTKTTGDNIFPLFWDVVKHLEKIGLKVKFIFEQQHTMLKMWYSQVLAATFDGASNNRRMVKLQNSSKGTVTHKVPNIHSNDGKRDIFFFSDPPHLIKTARNCLASKCRFLWVRKEKTMYNTIYMYPYMNL